MPVPQSGTPVPRTPSSMSTRTTVGHLALDQNAGMESIPAREVSDVLFDETVDVVVVGLGVAGSSAVVAARQAVSTCWRSTARRAGRDVGQLRRSHLPGRRHSPPARCGFDDSSENMAAFLKARSARAATTTGSTPTARVRRNTSTGWSPSACRSGLPSATSRTVSPPTTRDCSSAAARTRIPSTKSLVPVPRGTSPSTSIPPAASSWNAWVRPCRPAAPGSWRTPVPRHWLSMRGGRRGAHADRGGIARHPGPGGVILASGGFIHNDAMVAEHCPLAHVPDPAWRIGTPNDDGRGIRMGVGAGRRRQGSSAFECALPLGPPHRLARGILVNRHGKRFINEDAYTGRIGLHALATRTDSST